MTEYESRLARARTGMADRGIDAMCLSIGSDLPYLIGYRAMPLERLTMLVLPVAGEAVLVVPELEAPRVDRSDDLFSVRPWEELEDPIALVDGLLGDAGQITERVLHRPAQPAHAPAEVADDKGGGRHNQEGNQ